MCRDGYNAECAEDGCSERVTCRSFDDISATLAIRRAELLDRLAH